VLLPAQDETADGAHVAFLQRTKQQHVGAALRRSRRRRQVVRPVEEDRIDLVERHEARDLDRA